MDFFEQQSRARRQTRLLLVQFLLATTGILVLINVAIWGSMRLFQQIPAMGFLQWLSTTPGVSTSILILILITVGCVQRALELRKGGAMIAIQAGALPAQTRIAEPKVRRLMNVVEEMGIASGTPLPRVFILPDASINAFVAGSELRNTALVVTEGSLDLGREELQGIVGHEFAHIAHGDLKLNARLLVSLAGLMYLSRTGRAMTGWSTRRSVFYSSSRRKNEQSAALLGLLLFVCGYLGVFFGRLIQAAISRQREYHADASSVQYTRNVDGLASALDRIRQHSGFSYLTSTTRADELNHMCISESLAVSRWMASHPPLDDRIRRIDPGFERRSRIRRNQEKVQRHQQQSAEKPVPDGSMGFASNATHSHSASGPETQPLPAPENREARDNPTLLWALGARQWLHENLANALDSGPHQASAMLSLIRGDSPVPPAYRLPLLEILVANYKGQGTQNRTRLISDAHLTLARHPTFSGICYLALMEHHLAPAPVRKAGPVSANQKVTALTVVLSAFARLGAGTDAAGNPTKDLDPARLFKQHARVFFSERAGLTYRERFGSLELLENLMVLKRLSPHIQKQVLDAGLGLIKADGRLRRQEYELLRICAELMDHPLPPLTGG